MTTETSCELVSLVFRLEGFPENDFSSLHSLPPNPSRTPQGPEDKGKFQERQIKTPDGWNWSPSYLSNNHTATQPNLILGQRAKYPLCSHWPPSSAHAGPTDGRHKLSSRANTT